MLAVRDATPLLEDQIFESTILSEKTSGSIERHGYRPPGSSRVIGGLGTAAICSLIMIGFVMALGHIERPKVASPPLAVALISIASPKAPEPKSIEKPKPTPKELVTTQPSTLEPAPKPIVTLPALSPPTSIAPHSSIAPKVQTVQAPSSPPLPAPPTPSTPAPSNHGPDKWEGRILARLERFRRYPSDAQHARQQGTTYLRFRVDRDGHVLSASIDQSSGYPALDTAAMETLRRADPLPKIPSGRPDQVELVVPVEFSIGR